MPLSEAQLPYLILYRYLARRDVNETFRVRDMVGTLCPSVTHAVMVASTSQK